MAEFEDGKDDSALRTIGEVSEALHIKPHVLRYWEQQFSLLNPLKRSGGRRYYRPEDVALVEDINRLVNEEGYTLKGAEAVLRSSGQPGLDRRKGDRRSGDRRAAGSGKRAPAPEAQPAKAETKDLSETIAGLKAVRARLAKAIEA
ncbi:MAG: MerR family transcriptional regulator [Pseudomonadota bacterium]